MTDYEEFVIARWMYSICEPIMTDAEYSLLLDVIKVKYPDSEYLDRSWSSDPCPVKLLQDNGYADAIQNIILSDKTESISSVNDWVTLRNIYEDLDEEATLSYKHDGINIQASYYNGELVSMMTRGRASDPISAEVLKGNIPNKIGIMGRYTICMEATVSRDNFSYLKKQLGSKSQRAAARSCMARPEYVHMVDLHAFSIIGDSQILNPFPTLEEWGFKTPRWIIVHNYGELTDGMHQLDKELPAYQTLTDGLVIRATFTRAIRLLSWEEPIYKTYVTGYNETYGAYRMGIKAEVYPVTLPNSTQRQVSCTNWQRIIDYNLRVGYPIAFRLSSQAIADLDRKSTKLLQEQWKGKEDEYRAWIEERERIKLES